MADASFAKRRAYSFLVDIKNMFLSQFGDSWQTAIALQFDNQFSRTLQRRAVRLSKFFCFRDARVAPFDV